jgi:ribosomal-protein-alanine N-acetyltransferase
MKFKRFPEIQTERLLLRKIETIDADDILFLRTDAIVNQFIERPENRKTRTISDAVKFIQEVNEAFLKDKSITWGIAFRNKAHIIGTICLWNFSVDHKVAEVGYDLNPDFHRKGVMREALKSVVEFGFNELKLSKIEAFTNKNNEGSKKLLEKIGFQINTERTDPENSLNEIFEVKISA